MLLTVLDVAKCNIYKIMSANHVHKDVYLAVQQLFANLVLVVIISIQLILVAIKIVNFLV